jgi:tetratricopeptide (TPR) repeat protein
VLKIDPNFKDAWNDKGLCLINLGRYEEAIACYDKALKIDPDDKKAWFYKGVSLDIVGRQE